MQNQSEPLQSRSYLKLLLITAILGVLSGAITFIFIELVSVSQKLLWEQAAEKFALPVPIFTFSICTIGGVAVGLIVKTFGDHSGIFAEIMAGFNQSGRFDYRNAPGIVLNSLISLITGASLGPEAPLADACGGMGTWLSDRLKLDESGTRSLGFSGVSGMLGGFITSPFGGAVLSLESTRTGADYLGMLFPSLISSACATVVFAILSGEFFGALYTFPAYYPKMMDLLLALPLGLVGGIAGAVFIVLLKWLRKLMLPLKKYLVIRGLIGGVVLGFAGMLWPLTLFSGEEQTSVLIQSAASIGIGSLVVLALVKLFLTSLCLSTGWKGGYIFPIMFAGTALGMAVNLVFPGIPVAVAVAATMAGAMVAVMKAPIFSALFVLTLVQKEAAPVIAIAVIVSMLATSRLSIMQTRPENEA
jgi:H+/Cl- antiporter ClcA